MDHRVVGHQLGNFHDYYKFHSYEVRLNLIPDQFFLKLWHTLNKPKYIAILDIGCNEGDLTFHLYQRACHELKSCNCECYALGVDLDQELIEKASNKYSSNSNKLKFQVADITNENVTNEYFNDYLNSIGTSSFSQVCLFSITMWIHLNHGDAVLKRILELSCQWSNCCVIVEPQPWKCYKTAVKR